MHHFRKKNKNLKEDLRLDGKLSLEWILNSTEGHGLDTSDSGQREVPEFCERGNEHSGFIKCRGIID